VRVCVTMYSEPTSEIASSLNMAKNLASIRRKGERKTGRRNIGETSKKNGEVVEQERNENEEKRKDVGKIMKRCGSVKI